MPQVLRRSRNLEILRKRDQNRRYWTLGRLAKRYQLTDGRIAQIVKETRARLENGQIKPEN